MTTHALYHTIESQCNGFGKCTKGHVYLSLSMSLCATHVQSCREDDAMGGTLFPRLTTKVTATKTPPDCVFPLQCNSIYSMYAHALIRFRFRPAALTLCSGLQRLIHIFRSYVCTYIRTWSAFRGGVRGAFAPLAIFSPSLDRPAYITF